MIIRDLDIEDLYNFLQPYCNAIYLGGSRALGCINNPHDYDIIIFTKDTNKMEFAGKRMGIGMRLQHYIKEHQIPNTVWAFGQKPLYNCLDFIQIRATSFEERAYGSYINKLMIKLIGNDIDFTFDIINKDRSEYIDTLKHTIELLIREERPINGKRWYQVYTGLCIVLNKSYTFTEEQKKNINILHDMEDSTLEYRQHLQQEIQNILKDLQ